MRNIKLVLEYDGTNYHGWQTQPNLPTIQGTIEDALEKLTKTPIQIIGAGRTDSGVHAEGQVANFRTPSQIPLIAFQKGLNATLPRGYCCLFCNRGVCRFSCPFQCDESAVSVHDSEQRISECAFATDKLLFLGRSQCRTHKRPQSNS